MSEQIPTATKPAPIPVAEGEIPLPPAEMWAELDNSAAASAAVPRPAEVAELEFVGDAVPFREIPLTYPFRWRGEVVRSIIVRRYSVQQLGEMLDRLGGEEIDRMEIYAVMCGLPAAVLRALPEPDGVLVTGACHDFFPRLLAGAG